MRDAHRPGRTRDGDASTRPIVGTWSTAEYADHVREVLFAMRFVLDSAASHPGIDLGSSPETSFEHEPRQLELQRALGGLDREASRLVDRLTDLAPATWAHTAIIDGEAVDAHWICRHAVHDATHHLMDVRRIRSALSVS